MILDIFTYCALDKRPSIVTMLSERNFLAREPRAIGSRSGRDGEYGLVSLKRSGLGRIFGREKAYIGLTKTHISRLQQLGLRF